MTQADAVREALKKFQENERQSLIETAKDQVGSGYVPEYYLQIAADWLWLYECGFKAGFESKEAPNG